MHWLVHSLLVVSNIVNVQCILRQEMGGGGGGGTFRLGRKVCFTQDLRFVSPRIPHNVERTRFCYKIQDRTKTVSTQCRLRGCSVTMLGSPWQHHSAHFPSIWRPYVASGDIKIKSSHRPSANFYSRILIMSCLSSGPAQRDQNLGRGLHDKLLPKRRPEQRANQYREFPPRPCSGWRSRGEVQGWSVRHGTTAGSVGTISRL